ALCFFFNFVARGVGDTYIVFLLPLQSQFGWQRAQMTSVYSMLMLVAGLVSPLAGMVFERFGPRVLYAAGIALLGMGTLVASFANDLWHLYIGIGVFVGLGAGAVGMVPAAALLSWWYGNRMSTAIGVAYAGFGCGSLLLVPLAQALIDAWGWREAYRALGLGLLALSFATVWLPWRAITAPRPAALPKSHEAHSRSPLRAAMRQRRFWLLVQVMFFTALGMYLVIVQSVAYLVDAGFSALQAATAFGACGMLSVVGVSSSGWLSDRFSPRKAATVSFAGTALGVAALYAISFHASEVLLVAYVLLFGVCQGARGPVVAGLSARLFSGPGQATVYGAIYALMSFGTGLGALLSGALHDWTGGYRWGFGLALVSLAFAAAPFWTSNELAPQDRN
ncbi:MAG TPA: MFS transporter, partial [Ramlibacter sp.]|nr:MFS transporter [Ramlibacter sp.]